jgi:N-acetyl-anhydromuramyl-L-alanine amidase AmpD
MASPTQIKVTTFSAFTLPNSTRVRWDSGVSASNVIIGAQVRVPAHHRLSKKPTNREGQAWIDIRGIKGKLVLRLDPPAISLCAEAAGPLLGPPPRDAKKQFGVMAERRLRPLEIEVFLRDGFVRSDPPARAVAGMTHGRVIRTTGDSIEIDWKPDWVSARKTDSRSDLETVNVRLTREMISERPMGLLSSGKGIIVLHRTHENDIGSSINKFVSGEENAHYIIDLDGHVVKMVDDKESAAHHAGPNAQWEGTAPVNAFSIGIELVNESGTFPHAQMSGLISLLDKLRKSFKIPRDRVLAHCEVRRFEEQGGLLVNPRQGCPGPEFDWPLVEKNGHATQPSFREDVTLPSGFDEFFQENPDDVLMYPNSDRGKGAYGKKRRALPSGRHDLISQIQRNLFEIGYEQPSPPGSRTPWSPGEFDLRTELLVKRFQGRYMTGPRKQYLGDKGTEHLGKVTLHTVVMMQAVLAAKGREWRPFW